MFLCFLALGFFYSLYVIKTRIKPYDFNLSISEENVLLRRSFQLQDGSLVARADLKTLYPYLDTIDTYESWEKDKIEKGHLVPVLREISGGASLFRLVGDLSLELEKINDCPRKHCFQKRISFYDIPTNLWRGLMGVEDVRFLEHSGVDFKALLRAVWIDLLAMKFVQGGSTLTQQLVKNLYLSAEKKLARKVHEIILSFYIDHNFSKEEILQAYFNEINWGSLEGVSVNGIYAASVIYFDKKPAELTNYEVSILVAMLKGPYYYHPLKSIEALKDRANFVFDKLQELKFLSEIDSAKWSKKDWDNWVKKLNAKNKTNQARIISELFRNNYKIDNFYSKYVLISSAERTLDEMKAREHLKEIDLAYKIWIHPFNCGEDCENFSYYSKVERDLEVALKDERHQVGSILKPIIYRAIRDEGYKWDYVLSTEPIMFKLPSGNWSPKESSVLDVEQVTLEQALRLSRNIPLLRIVDEIGFGAIEKKLIDKVPHLKVPLKDYPSQLLGSIELSLNELGEVFTQFISSECNDVSLGDKTFEETVIAILSDPNLTTIADALRPMMREMRFFGKTGTSNSSFDNWFVGFDGKQLAIIWFGLEGVRRDQEKLKLSGTWTAYKIYENYYLHSGIAPEMLSCTGVN